MIFVDTNVLYNVLVETEFSQAARNIILSPSELAISITVIRVLPANEDLADWQRVMRRYNLLPTDALIASTCIFHGITEIATFDNDFGRVESLRVVGMGHHSMP